MIPELPHADPEELAALYAAGAMSPGERTAFEALLAEGCQAFNGELQLFDPVVTRLACAVPSLAPRAETKAALLKRIADQKSPTTTHPAQAPTGFFFQKASDAPWKPTGTPGVDIRIMYVDKVRQRVTACLKMAPGHRYPHHAHPGVEEVFVLEGDLRLGDTVLRPGDYQRAEGGTHHEDQYSESGCLILIQMSLAALQK